MSIVTVTEEGRGTFLVVFFPVTERGRDVSGLVSVTSGDDTDVSFRPLARYSEMSWSYSRSDSGLPNFPSQ
jgi:hypothetical protein